MVYFLNLLASDLIDIIRKLFLRLQSYSPDTSLCDLETSQVSNNEVMIQCCSRIAVLLELP